MLARKNNYPEQQQQKDPSPTQHQKYPQARPKLANQKTFPGRESKFLMQIPNATRAKFKYCLIGKNVFTVAKMKLHFALRCP